VARIGADIGQLASLKRTFDAQSRAVQDLTRSVAGQVDQTWWIGPAADKFKAEWRSSFEPTLRRLEAALQEAGLEVERRRSQLEQAGS
jgi:uncharacterized protein YukE